MRIALASVEFIDNDINYNAETILTTMRKAKELGASLVFLVKHFYKVLMPFYGTTSATLKLP